MELTVYRQSSKTRPDGTVVYKGEDALPYVDGQIFFVADGLGGAAAIRHQKIKPELFESEKLLQTLFSGVYEDYSDPRFADYVINSFFELFAVKDCYTDNINNIKKSGYFASRIVTAIVLHEIIYNSEMSAENIFRGLSAAREAGEDGAYLEKTGAYFKELIKNNIKKIAENANLIYESSYSGLALLGSTLCATLYLQGEGCVEAIYLTAGDSRPYTWSVEAGLQQIIADQEGKDGGMTNYIKANDDADFDICCSYFKFKTPCVIFNASDGCFDSGKFLSQLAFEKLILESAWQSESTEETAKKLKEFFLEFGRHDDSSTIAMKLCGYGSFSDFKRDAEARLEVLRGEYFMPMPELLDGDYSAEWAVYEKSLPQKMSELRDKMKDEVGVKDLCREAVIDGGWEAYLTAISDIDREIESEKGKINEAERAIENIIACNFVKFMPYLEQRDGFSVRMAASKIAKAEAYCKEAEGDYRSELEHLKAELEGAVGSLEALFAEISELGVPYGFESFDKLNLGVAQRCERSMYELFSFINGIRAKKLDSVRRLSRSRSEYIGKNIRLAEEQPQNVSILRLMVCDGSIDLEGSSVMGADKASLLSNTEKIRAAIARIGVLDTEARAQALDTAVGEYWNEHYAEVIAQAVRMKKEGINETVFAEAEEFVENFGKEAEEIRRKSELQTRLFEKYGQLYNAYIKKECEE